PHFSPLSLHDALPISLLGRVEVPLHEGLDDVGDTQSPWRSVLRVVERVTDGLGEVRQIRMLRTSVGANLGHRVVAPLFEIPLSSDRKSTRLNSSHQII